MAENQRYFQWIFGERRGDILIFKQVEEDDGNLYIAFKDGSRINETFVAPLNAQDLTGKMMAEIDHPSNFWKFQEELVGQQEEIWETNAEGERVCVQPFVEGKKIIRYIPPKPSGPRNSSFGIVSTPPLPPVVIEVEKFKTDVNINDPVYITLEKSKKVEFDVDLTITVTAPSKELFNLIKENFENGEQKTIDYIIQHIDIEYIKKSLITSFKNLYNPKKDI